MIELFRILIFDFQNLDFLSTVRIAQASFVWLCRNLNIEFENRTMRLMHKLIELSNILKVGVYGICAM